jgi:hypothetical protein
MFDTNRQDGDVISLLGKVLRTPDVNSAWTVKLRGDQRHSSRQGNEQIPLSCLSESDLASCD